LVMANAEGGAQRHSLAIEHSRQAVEIARSLGDSETEFTGSRFIGCAYNSLGDRDSASKWLSEAIALQHDSSIKPNLAAMAYSEMGDVLFREGKYLGALPYQHEAAQLCERSGNATLLAYSIQRLGLTYGMLGRQEDATRYLKDAVARAEAIPDRMSRL